MKRTSELLLTAYSIGNFPMAESSNDPEERGILPLDQLHVPRRLKRRIRQGAFDVRCNTAFGEVIHACAKPLKPLWNATWAFFHSADLVFSTFFRLKGRKESR